MNTLHHTQLDKRSRKHYKDVPQELLQPFLSFRAQHPFKTATINNTQWEYLDTGRGSDVILLLTGVLGIPIMDWRHITYFSQKYRVIAPCYASLASMNTLVDGIAGILQLEGISGAQVWGGSYGGAVAQVFVRRHMSLSRNLIISHSFPPNSESGTAIQKMMRWMRLLPEGLLRWVLNRSLSRLMPEDTEGMALTLAIYNELMHTRMTKDNLMAIMECTIQYAKMVFTPHDLISWSGSVLLILSDDDPSTSEETRNTLRTLYPEAKLHIFHGAGHATSLLKESEYRSVIETFISE